MFSARVPSDLHPNRLAHAVARARADGRQLLDLTVSNPTIAGIEYPASILDELGDSMFLQYDPQPFGLLAAREAVAADYARRGIDLEADRIILTASTSEAYSLLFKLLCEPAGDRVLVPVPSYPLFEHLTRLDGVQAIPYSLEYHGRWMLDRQSLEQAWITTRPRGVVAVSPNNPTGSVFTRVEIEEIAERCGSREAALIIDEVFADYRLESLAAADAARLDESLSCLTFRLGGLSKSAGLPQVKLGWIGVTGPARLVSGALSRLELICDTYLSVSTPVQTAAATLLRCGAVVRDRILDRVRHNYGLLRGLAASRPAVEVLHAEAGWSAVVRVPSTRSEEDLVLELLDRDAVLVHPGFFFDFAHEAFLVVSLLADPPIFREGVRRMLERADA